MVSYIDRKYDTTLFTNGSIVNSYIYSFTGLSTDTKPTDEQVAQYFEDHPEAVIPDGSVTANKLSSTAYATQAEVNSIIAIIEGGD